MFIRTKRSGPHKYLQIVHNERVDGRVRQRVIATLGRLDELQREQRLDELACSCAKFSQHTAVLSAHRRGQSTQLEKLCVGPSLVFERLWRELGLPAILDGLLNGRRFGFSIERAVFLTVLHRLFSPGSDRAAEHWQHGYRIDGERLELHQLYRAMGWLGEALPGAAQLHATRPGVAPRCRKDEIEEAMFTSRSGLFSEMSLAFFDTTSIYFEGRGGESIGENGLSKDKRPDLKQMVVGAVLSDDGTPLCSEMWPGNTTDVTSLLPVIRRLEKRFGITRICVVADRGMISEHTVQEIETHHRDLRYILGARLRSTKEVRDDVMRRGGRYKQVHGPRQKATDPSPLAVKDVYVGERRYVVCFNEEQARKDRADREAILAGLEEQLRRGDKSLVGNKGYRKYIKTTHAHFQIDTEKVKAEARFDGKWALRTNLFDADAAEVALRYKDLWMVEQAFRSIKSILETRPIYHKRDATIRGHVFCSFIAIVLLKELLKRLNARGWGDVEWDRVKQDLLKMDQTLYDTAGGRFLMRDDPAGDAGKALQAAGVALGPAVRKIEDPL